MAITNLYAKVYFPLDRGWNLPVIATTHGFIEQTTNVPVAMLQRWANLGFVVVCIGMRGRDGASGQQDASGREIYDIVDAVEYVRARNPFASQTKAAFVGMSGGGGNGMAAACKFPDYWNVIVSHYGISDYGYDGTDGWWYTSPTRQATLTTWVGDRAASSDPYYARMAPAAISNFTGGKLYLYHDKQDTNVPWVNSDNVKTALDAAGMTNYSATFTDVGDPIRFTHDSAGNESVEAIWSAEINSRAVWTVPASGTVTVIGYIKTKRFTIWLKKNGTALAGLDAAATVVYDTATDTYTVTPLVSGIDVTVTQGAKTGSATNISAETPITVV